jgi:hypothetical protein
MDRVIEPLLRPPISRPATSTRCGCGKPSANALELKVSEVVLTNIGDHAECDSILLRKVLSVDQRREARHILSDLRS